MHTRHLVITALLILLLAAACSGISSGSQPAQSDENTLTIFAAASLTDAFTEVAGQFEADHPEIEVALNFAGSQQLSQQLAEGAPADIFASANLQQMQSAIDAGRIQEDTPTVMINNNLVIIYPVDNPAFITRIIDLARPGVRLVLAADVVPAGAYTLEFLEKASQDPAFGEDFKQGVLDNVVSYEQNVRAVLNKVVLGEADAGIVYRSDLSASDPTEIGLVLIPDPLNISASYLIAPTSDTNKPELTQEFIDLVISTGVQDLLSEYGFIPVY